MGEQPGRRAELLIPASVGVMDKISGLFTVNFQVLPVLKYASGHAESFGLFTAKAREVAAR